MNKKVAHEAIAECVTDNIITKQTTGDKAFSFTIFQHNAKAGLCPLWRTRKKKKSIWRILLPVQNEAMSLVTMRGKEFWLVTENHAIVKVVVKPDSKLHSSWNEELKRNWQNSTAKSTNLIEDAGKVKSVFVIRAAFWAKKLGLSLEYCQSWKNTLGNFVVAMNTRGHLIGVLNERNVSDGETLCLPSVVGSS